MLDRSKVRDLYLEVSELPEAERAMSLQQRCAGDAELQAEVESLLRAAAERPAFMSVATFGAEPGQGGGEGPGTRIGPYRLLQELGRGGFGTVYMAEQESPVRRRVALKIIKLGMDTRAVIHRFEAERQALAMMDHPHVAKVFDAGATASGRPFFVMELVQGEPINDYADKAGLNIERRLSLFVQVCQAVQHAHMKGVIHRDIKPGNVLVTTRDGRPHVTVIDFGIAKATESPLTEKTIFTEFHQFVGTPEYMSPEQAGGAPDVDSRSDVYSLGVLLYELLTGATPFDSKTLRAAAYDEIQRIIREVDPPKPSTRLSELESLASVATLRRTEPGRLSSMVSGDLDWIVMKAMEKDRTRRYDTADALAADINRHLEGAAVEAAPPSRAYLARKFVSRHRGLVISATAIAGVLALGIAGTAVGLVAAIRAGDAARASAKRAALEARQATDINEFMREVLTSVEPQKSGADVRLMDVMAKATASASDRFRDDPLLEAQVQDLLAGVYNRIGMLVQTKAAAQRALALYQTLAGRDDPRTLQAESRVAGAALDLIQTDEAERAIASLLPRAESILGSDHSTTLDLRRAQATVHMLRGRTDEAEKIFLELLAHPRLASDDRTLSRILYSLCRIRQRRAISQDPVQLKDDLKRTEEYARECVERSMRAAGPGSTDVLRAQAILAQTLCDLGHNPEAAELCRVILAQSEAKFDNCHIHLRTVMAVLADALAAMGSFNESADLYQRIIECARTASATDPVSFISSLGDGLKYFDRAGRAAEGEATAREALAALSRFGGAHQDVAGAFESYLAHFVSMSGRVDEAEPLFVRLLANEESLPGPTLRARLQRFYAAHLSRRGLFQEAEGRLQRAVSIYGQAPKGVRDPVPDETLCGFIDLYKAWDRSDKVREFERLREERFGSSTRQ